MAAAAASPLTRLAEWADSHAKEFEVVAQKRDADAPLADRALEIVRRFIIERQLILYGGQAIDFALRLKGSQIYPDHQTPDYDFFSPRSVDDAYELADRLVAAGFPNVGAIPAIHTQTMRVATDFIYVADISYTPQNVFDSLPTVSYAGMRVLHPDFQRTDMHLAFCFPFNNPPREDIFHRYHKDLKRFRLFQEFYPISAGQPCAARAAEPQAFTVEVDLSRAAIHGFAGYALIRDAFEELEKAARSGGVAADVLASARALVDEGPSLKIEVTAAARGRRHVVFFAPPAAAARLALATPWPDDLVADITSHTKGEAQWFAPYMDSRPLMARITQPGAADVGIDVFSTRNSLLAVFKVVSRGGAELAVATPQYILMNFLHEAHAASADLRDLYVRYYTATLGLIEAGDLLIAALRAEGGGPAVADAVYRSFVESSPFGLPVQTIGDANHDSSYLIRLAQAALRVGDKPPGIDPTDLPDLANVPTRYYPGGRHFPGERPPFDYEANVVFQRGGRPIKPPRARPLEGGGPADPPAAAARRGGSSATARTYVALFEELDGRVLDQILRQDGGWEKVSIAQATRAGYVDLVVVDGKYNWDRRLWGFVSGLKSCVRADVLTNKVNLHERLMSQAPDLIPETVVVPNARTAQGRLVTLRGIGSDSPWIWRPERGWSGQRVQVLDTQKGVDQVSREHARRSAADRALLTRYITDPVTIDINGMPHKIHLRLYLVIVAGPNGQRSGLVREGEIARARDPYAARDFGNPRIHDTHSKWSEGLRFPRDYPGRADLVLDQTVGAMTKVSRAVLSEISSCPESKAGFEVLGVDLIVDASERVWLIEISPKPGYGRPAAKTELDSHNAWISGVVFGAVHEFVLAPGPFKHKYVIPCYELKREVWS